MSTAETGSGFITGVDPRQELPTAQSLGVQTGQAQPPVQIVMNQPPAQQTQEGRFYSEEQVAAMRAETDQRLAQMGAQLQALTEERETREAQLAADQQAAADAKKAADEAQMDVRQLMEKRDQEWQSRWDELQTQRERDLAIFEREREWGQLQEYRRQRIEQEEPFLMPQLRDLIQGATVEEIDQSIELMKQRSSSIMADIQEAQAQIRPPLRGASPTGQPSMGGPLEQQANVEQLSVQQIKDMDNQTYSRYRDRLMQYTRRG
jgi:hypothetical protein